MPTGQPITRERRQYNEWAASQTLEDYALRFTARKARRWGYRQIAVTAIGATSFLACEAIGGTITLAYGFANAAAAIAAAVALMFVVGVPIAYHAAREGLDVDLLTRGAGFGYLGATVTSLIYASFTFLLFGLALSTLLSLLPQIGEQADYLRFLPEKKAWGDARWWAAMLCGGPGWVVVGGVKLMLGSFLALFALSHGEVIERAASPSHMFYVVFHHMVPNEAGALMLTGLLVLVCQMKINVTNAYAGSIAWSNFFSRLTHAHPGRVVWLVFNVLLALLLMEIGIIRVIEGILIVYANLAAGWMGALSADLMISKPLGLSPPRIEFKRAHLYGIYPVGVGAMGLSIIVSTCALAGLLGRLPQAFSPLLGLAVAFVAAPAIALATRRRFYISRVPGGLPEGRANSSARYARMLSSAPTWSIARPIWRRSAHCAARWKPAATTCARRTAAFPNRRAICWSGCCRR